MAEVIKMPRLSDTMEEGNIVAWLKSVGDKVSPGDILAEVETDKATMELESFFEGTLLYIGVPEGPVEVDGVIAIIGNKDENIKEILQGIADEEAKESKPEKIEKSTPIVDKTPAKEMVIPTKDKEVVAKDGRVFASPLAKSMASDEGISLGDVKGTGEGGRIIKRDILDYVSNPPVKTSSSQGQRLISIESDFQYGEVPVSQMRKVIARRLGESKFSAPHFYVTIEVDMGNAIKSRKVINADPDVKISFNDFVLKATASALRKHPNINSSWLGDKIVYNEEINIGVAVAVPDGLLVPVIKNADLKSMSLINREVKLLAGKAKNKKLSPAEMQGNTFTISNLGMFDVDEFTAIINPPDACILAVGSIAQKPIVKDGQIVVGNIMKLTLSCDHRVVDGASAAIFLRTLKGLLQEPVKILV